MAAEAARPHPWRARVVVIVLALLAVAALVWWVRRIEVLAPAEERPSEDCADSTVLLVRHAHLGRVEAVRDAIAAGADVDAPDAHGNTPLACVHPRGSVEIVAALLDAGADPDVADRFGDPIVADAVRFCHDDVLELVLDAGADPDDGGDRDAPLARAVAGGRPTAVELLLAAGAAPALGAAEVDLFGGADESESECPEPSPPGRAEALGLVLAAGGDGDEALAWAVRLRIWDAVPAALAAGADPNADQGSDLRDLLCAGAAPSEISADSCTASTGVAVLGRRTVDPATLGATTEGQPPVERPPSPALLDAAWVGEADAVRALLDAGADPNAVGPNGVTALAAAAGAGREAVVDLLLPVVALPLPEGAILPSQVADVAGHTALADRLRAAGA